MNQNFWQRNKVFLTGLAAALALALTEFTVQPTVDWKVVGYAALMAVLSYAANTWRGQGVTILGVLGTLAGTFVSLQTTGHFTWAQFFISAVAAVLAAVASPPKPLGYEKTSTIENAKAQGRQMSKVIILLIGLSLAMSSTTHAQSFFKALPKESAKYGAAAPGGTLNLFRPSINLVSYSVPGVLMPKFGILPPWHLGLQLMGMLPTVYLPGYLITLFWLGLPRMAIIPLGP
jgi:hypothetical protein